MKVSKGLFVLLVCIGMLLGYSMHAQEDANAPEQEVEYNFDETQVESEDTQEQYTPSDEQEQPVEEEQAQEQEVQFEEPAEAEQQEPQQEQIEQEEQEPAQEDVQQEEQQESFEPAQEEEQENESSSGEQSESPEEPAQEQEAQSEEQQVPMPPDEIMGLDTVDLEDPQGNWLFKRVWWERAEQKVEKIRALVTQIMEKRTGFFSQRAELDKNVLDPFYINIGLKRGELLQRINDLIADMKSQSQTHRPETEAFEKLQKNKKELEALATEVEKVSKQDEAIEKALLQFVDQINKLRGYEQQAWQDFKDIARVLDDKKARELFYKVDNAWQNVQKVQEYVDQQFTGSFDKLIAEVTKQIDRIKNEVEALSEQGVSLYKQITKHDTDEDQDDDQEEKPQPEVLRSILDSFMAMVRKVFNTLVAIVRWPYDVLIRTDKQAKQAIAERDEEKVDIEEDEVEVQEPQESTSASDMQDEQSPVSQEPTSEIPGLAPMQEEPMPVLAPESQDASPEPSDAQLQEFKLQPEEQEDAQEEPAIVLEQEVEQEEFELPDTQSDEDFIQEDENINQFES